MTMKITWKNKHIIAKFNVLGVQIFTNVAQCTKAVEHTMSILAVFKCKNSPKLLSKAWQPELLTYQIRVLTCSDKSKERWPRTRGVLWVDEENGKWFILSLYNRTVREFFNHSQPSLTRVKRSALRKNLNLRNLFVNLLVITDKR